MTEESNPPVQKHSRQNKKRLEKNPDDPIKVTRGGLEVCGLRKDEEKLIEQLLEMEKKSY